MFNNNCADHAQMNETNLHERRGMDRYKNNCSIWHESKLKKKNK